MKRIIFTSITVLFSTLLATAQKLVITEVDAPANTYFNAMSSKTLGKGMDLNISGKTLSVKIGDQPEIMLAEDAYQSFKTERKTDNGILKISIKLKTTNSKITTAEFTGIIIPYDKNQKKTWWTVTARDTDEVPVM